MTRSWGLLIALAAAMLQITAGLAQEAVSGLYDRPVLALDPGVHTAPIKRAAVDASGRFVVTGSNDGTVRVWSAADGELLRTIQMPVGPGELGKVNAVAISPDGTTIAAGGWMRWTAADPQEHIYLFDRETGAMIGRLGGLPDVVNHFAVSPDGTRLAAMIGDDDGLRLYAPDAEGTWRETAADLDYSDHSYGVAFAADGRLATTSLDGQLRLYDRNGRRVASVQTGAQPYGLAFHPEDGRLAVGFNDAPEVRLFDGETLAEFAAPDMNGIDNGDLATVAWSLDGGTLYAAGQYRDGSGNPVFAWEDAGAGARRALRAGDNTVSGLIPLPDGALLVAAQDPWLGVVAADGALRWRVAQMQIDLRGQNYNLAVSEDGMVVEFGLSYGGEDRRRFDLAALGFAPMAEDGRVQEPQQKSLAVADWDDSFYPTLNDGRLALDLYEYSRSLAIHPDGDRFVLGADWSLRAFDAEGAELWRRPVPAAPWAVNITGDGRFAVAAYADGTLRWHRMEDGVELLALFPFADGENWVVWEPDGRYAATLPARHALRWVVNRGWDTAPLELGAGQIGNSFAPEVIRRILPLGGTPDAVYAAEEARRAEDFRRLTGGLAPGAQLHVLAVGISNYGAQATRLKLDWADDDAADIAAALAGQVEWPYRRGVQITLRDEEATAVAILDQLDAIRRRMALAPGGSDLAVLMISGHGVVIGEGETAEFYLLPHGADIATPSRIRGSGISGIELRAQIAALAGVGRVLVLLDTCSSGAALADGQTLGAPSELVRALAGKNVTVLASSSATQVSREDADWRNGAFTEAVLEALGQNGDSDGNGMVSVGELTDYVSRRLPVLAGQTQTPSIASGFSGDLFASEM